MLLVDTSVAPMGAKIKAAIAKVSSKPIKLVINTHAHADHFGANELMAQGGAVIIGHDALRERMAKGQYLAAFNQTIPPSPPAALPTVTYADAMTIHFDGETVELVHVPGAHTDNDTLVRFKRANVIHASGTIGGNGGYPFFDMSSGGSLAGTIAAEEKMLSLSDDKTRIVADEGDPASTADLKASRDALVTIRARVQKLIDEGKSEAEAIAAKPTPGPRCPMGTARRFPFRGCHHPDGVSVAERRQGLRHVRREAVRGRVDKFWLRAWSKDRRRGRVFRRMTVRWRGSVDLTFERPLSGGGRAIR